MANRIIRPSQTAFLPGRFILGVVTLHETIHELKRKKQSGILLKLNFVKAYDKVNWDFFTIDFENERVLSSMVLMD